VPGWSVGWQQAKSLVAAFLMNRRPLRPPMCISHFKPLKKAEPSRNNAN